MPYRRSHEEQATARYAGARLTANPGGASAAPQAARVGAFVQGLLAARGSCARAGDVARLFREIEGGNPNSAAPLNPAEEAALSRLVADANAALEPMQLAVKRVTLPEPAVVRRGAENRGATNNNGNENDENENDENGRQQQQRPAAAATSAAAIAGAHSRSFYGVVNVEPDPVALANGWGLSPTVLAYLRAVLERMVRSSDTPCGSVAQEALLSIDHAAEAVAEASAAAQRAAAEAAAAAAALDNDDEDDEDDDGGEARRQRTAAAAAAAARASATQPPPALKRSERGAALQSLADCGWLVKTASPPPGGGGGAGARRGGGCGGDNRRESSRGGSVVSFGIGPRSFMELGELLRSFDPAPEVLAAWAAQL